MNEEIQAFFYALRTGTIKKWPPQRGVECPTCEGAGHEMCDACRGSGTATKTCGHCGESTSVQCSECSGKRPTCRRCAGSGTVDLPAMPKIHPADAWTLKAIRTLSVNGSFT